MDKRPIGFIDSGIGGLSIWQSVRTLLPNESTVYVGDNAFVPYGEKSREFIRSRIQSLIRFQITQNAKLIVIACNTATIAGIEIYRKNFPKIPIIGVVPVIKKASEITRTGEIAVLSTPFTSRSAYQHQLIKRFASGIIVHPIAVSKAVSYIENGDSDSVHLKKHLHVLLEPLTFTRTDTVVLGCTHFPFIRRMIEDELAPHTWMLDSGGAVARQVERVMISEKIISNTSESTHKAFTTGNVQRVNSAVAIHIVEDLVFSPVSIP